MTVQEFKDFPPGDFTNTDEQVAAATALVSRMPDADLLLRALGLVHDNEVPVDPKHFKLCPKGQHRITPDNRLDTGKCKRCQEEADILAAGAGTKYKLDRVCKNGHDRTPENTLVQPDGLRRCLICRRETNRRFAKTRPSRDQTKSKCVHGHLLSEDNVKVDSRGARRCIACNGTRESWKRVNKPKSVDS